VVKWGKALSKKHFYQISHFSKNQERCLFHEQPTSGALPLHLITCQIFRTVFRGKLTEPKGFLKTDMPPGAGIPFFKILHVIFSLPFPAGTCRISGELHAHNLCYLFSFSCVTRPPSPCCKLPNSNSVCDTLERMDLVSFFSQTSSRLFVSYCKP
jgi:hypothetical protein